MKLSEIKKVLKERGKTEYEKGVKDAMSMAVNMFNVPEYIREKVIENILKKKL